QLCADTNLPEFRRLLNSFVRQVVVPKGKLRQPVAVQRYMNVRIMLPNTPELYFPLHTGLLYGHGIASRSLWMPFVDVTADEDKTRSMQIIPIKKSRELTKYAIEKRLKMAEMTKVWGQHAHQIKPGPGSRCICSATCWSITLRRKRSPATTSCSIWKTCCTARRCCTWSRTATPTSSCTASLHFPRWKRSATTCSRSR